MTYECQGVYHGFQIWAHCGSKCQYSLLYSLSIVYSLIYLRREQTRHVLYHAELNSSRRATMGVRFYSNVGQIGPQMG